MRCARPIIEALCQENRECDPLHEEEILWAIRDGYTFLANYDGFTRFFATKQIANSFTSCHRRQPDQRIIRVRVTIEELPEEATE